MNIINAFVIVVVCLLAYVEVGSSLTITRPPPGVVSLQSVYRLEHDSCRGNLIKINSGRSKAICNGTSTNHSNTRFMIKPIEDDKKCIQFTDEQDGNKVYSLKVTDTNKVVFEQHRCDPSSTSNDDAFLFYEKVTEGYRMYRHNNLYLGVTDNVNCSDHSLSLICTSSEDRRCFFDWLEPQGLI